jgi:hypothetical protein
MKHSTDSNVQAAVKFVKFPRIADEDAFDDGAIKM